MKWFERFRGDSARRRENYKNGKTEREGWERGLVGMLDCLEEGANDKKGWDGWGGRIFICDGDGTGRWGGNGWNVSK